MYSGCKFYRDSNTDGNRDSDSNSVPNTVSDRHGWKYGYADSNINSNVDSNLDYGINGNTVSDRHGWKYGYADCDINVNPNADTSPNDNADTNAYCYTHCDTYRLLHPRRGGEVYIKRWCTWYSCDDLKLHYGSLAVLSRKHSKHYSKHFVGNADNVGRMAFCLRHRNQ